MPAHFIPVGEPAHEAERQGLRILVEGLPSGYTVYGNAWLTEPSGVVYELDAVVVAPHAIFVVEIKSWRGRIEGTDHDWYIPEAVPSPIKLARKTAQSLHGLLKRENFQAGQVWIQDLVFLSATTNVGVQGPASKDRVHTRQSILAAIQDPALVKRTSSRGVLSSTAPAESDLLKLLTGDQRGPRPARRVREYEVIERVDHQETFSEVIGRNTLSETKRLLRIYSVPPLATEEQRKRIEERARWEAQVLGRLGRCPGILTADSPFTDEAGIVIPFEHFAGITLATWLERYGPLSKKPADLEARTDLWRRIAEAVDEAHHQGVVHRLLRPEVILVEDTVKPQQVRVTGFELAKVMASDGTIALSTTMGHERFRFAAPEVVATFSNAEPASDQFGLGVLLALLLTGRPLFDSTRALMAAQRLMTRVRDHARNVPLTLDDAVSQMLALRPTERFPSIRDAIDKVIRGRNPTQPTLPTVAPAALDPDNLEKGTRIGRDYEIEGRLGQGGMAVVYAARHLVSGRVRALKVARPEPAAQEALRGEYAALDALDHPNIVRVVDINYVVGDRLTLVMERVSGTNLRHYLRDHPTPEPQTQRRYAEDLLAGLEYLERKGVVHKDLKPDNLLVGDAGLTIIDFSLASAPEEAPYGGTALYRDPASARWTPGTDRYAAALCLFELYAGRHAFDGRVPEPGQAPSVTDQDIDPPGLAAFFRKALNPSAEQRFPSAHAMRSALLLAIGSEVAPEIAAPTAPAVGPLDAGTPLPRAGLSRRALNVLSRSRLTTVGELLQLPESQVRALHAIGKKTADEVLAFQAAARAQGIGPVATPANLDPLLGPDLADSPEPVERLALPSSTLRTLRDANLPTVGAVASLTHRTLLATKGVGRNTAAQIVAALHAFRERTPGSAGRTTLDTIWELAARPLTELQRRVVERVVGVLAEPETQGDIAADLGFSQSMVSTTCTEGLTRLDMGALAEALSGLEMLLDGVGGITSVTDAAARFEETWPPGVVRGEGLLRLLARVSTGRFHLLEIEGFEQPILARPAFDRVTLRGFAAEARRLAEQWPPIDPISARRTISAFLPGYERDALGLAVQLCSDIETTDTGHLFIGPLDAKLTLSFVLERERDPLTFGDLKTRVRRVFGERCNFPETDHLLALLRDLDVQVQGEQILPGQSRSVVAPSPPLADTLPLQLSAERSPEAAVRDLLRDAATSRGFRMLVTPPEKHTDIGPSVARALGARWISFEQEFFTKYEDDLARLERAERFAAQRDDLTDAAEELLFALLEEHGRAGHVIVLGDTALLGLCGALDLPRRLYDETLSGAHGFWVLIVPGVIHNRQPLFNERAPMWQLQGATFPLNTVMPA